MNEQIKELILNVVAEVIEVDAYEMEENNDFEQHYEVDSLRKIEILARLEKILKINIPQTELARMKNLKNIHDIVAERIGK
jgi:acyl carrier protein